MSNWFYWTTIHVSYCLFTTSGMHFIIPNHRRNDVLMISTYKPYTLVCLNLLCCILRRSTSEMFINNIIMQCPTNMRRQIQEWAIKLKKIRTILFYCNKYKKINRRKRKLGVFYAQWTTTVISRSRRYSIITSAMQLTFAN